MVVSRKWRVVSVKWMLLAVSVKWTVGQMNAFIYVSVKWMLCLCVGQMSVGEMSVGEMSVGQMN